MPIGMRDEDHVYQNVVMMPKKKVQHDEFQYERREIDQTFAPLSEEEKMEYARRNGVKRSAKQTSKLPPIKKNTAINIPARNNSRGLLNSNSKYSAQQRQSRDNFLPVQGNSQMSQYDRIQLNAFERPSSQSRSAAASHKTPQYSGAKKTNNTGVRKGLAGIQTRPKI